MADRVPSPWDSNVIYDEIAALTFDKAQEFETTVRGCHLRANQKRMDLAWEDGHTAVIFCTIDAAADSDPDDLSRWIYLQAVDDEIEAAMAVDAHCLEFGESHRAFVALVPRSGRPQHHQVR